MPEGVGSKERKRTIQASLNLPEESTGTIKIAIPNQRDQTKAKLRSQGPPDPGRSQATAPAFFRQKRSPGIIGPWRFGCFF